MSNEKLTSVWAKYIESFIAEKEAQGYGSHQYRNLFVRFDRMMNRMGINDAFFSKELFDAWAVDELTDVSNTTKRNKLSKIRQFSIYLCKLGIESYIPAMPRLYSDYIPYVYSNDEIGRIFETADSLRYSSYTSKSVLMAIPAILRLLYSTGIRIGEAVSLTNRDVDFDKKILLLNKTKNGHQRLAPINASLDKVLRQYLSYRDRMPLAGITKSDRPFFITHRGRKMTTVSVRAWFNIILHKASITSPTHCCRPCIHGLRHTAAVHAMRNMIEKGRDIYACMPILSVFLGHTKLQSTEYYLRLTKDRYPEILEKDAAVTVNISNVISRSMLKYEEE